MDPLHIIVPLISIPTLLHIRYASAMEWVVNTTDASLYYALATNIYCTSILDLGSSPVVGSSMNNLLDPPIKQIPICTFLLSPPLKYLTYLCLIPSKFIAFKYAVIVSSKFNYPLAIPYILRCS